MRRSNSPTIRMFGAFCCSLFNTFHNLTRLSDAPLCDLMFFLALQFTFKRFRDDNKNKGRYPCHHIPHHFLFRSFFASKFHFFLSHLVTFATLLSSFLSYLIEGFFCGYQLPDISGHRWHVHCCSVPNASLTILDFFCPTLFKSMGKSSANERKHTQTCK